MRILGYNADMNICFALPSEIASMDLWLIEMICGLGFLLGGHFILKKAIKHIRKRSLTLPHDWKEGIDSIFLLPCQLLLWILGLTLVAEVLCKRFGVSFFSEYLSTFRATGAVFCSSWILLRWKRIMLQHFLRKKERRVDAGFAQTTSNILTVCIGALTLLIVMQLWGLNMGPLIAFGGIGAAAVGFAAKDVIANFFGGLMLAINRPFVVGDWIELQQHKIEGQVEEIGWYLTAIRDREKRPVYLPNALFSHIVVANFSRMTHRRLQEQIPLCRIDVSKLSGLSARLREKLASHSDVDEEMPLLVSFHVQDKNDLRLALDLYTLQTRYEDFMAFRQDILLFVLAELEEAGMLHMGRPMMVELSSTNHLKNWPWSASVQPEPNA